MEFQEAILTLEVLLQKHTIFGRVYSGMGTVQRLGNIQTGMNPSK